jgi:hypothetical protein
MSYKDFTLPRVQADFGLTIQTQPDLFGHIPPIALDAAFLAMLAHQAKLGLSINTEKARSEWLIAPILAEFWRRTGEQGSLLSGVDFDVDPDAGLNGWCDFIIGRGPQLHYVTAPVVCVIEGKNESIANGLGQCAAVMVAAQRFNQREGNGIDTVYGIVTTGSNWKFLRLGASVLAIDLNEYLLSQADHILGILLHIVGPLPQPASAA